MIIKRVALAKDDRVYTAKDFTLLSEAYEYLAKITKLLESIGHTELSVVSEYPANNKLIIGTYLTLQQEIETVTLYFVDTSIT